MSLKDWMKKVESSFVNEGTQTVMLPTMKQGSTSPSGEQTAVAIDTSKPGGNVLAAALGAKPGSSTTVISPNSPVKAVAGQSTTQPATSTTASGQQTTAVAGQGNQAGLKEDDVMEVAPPGMEDVVLALKKKFPGHPERAFAIAWSRYNKQHGKTEESVMESKQLNEGSLDEIIGNHPHEHRMCQEGWGMDNSLFEALADHYFKEGRIPRSVWHGSAEGLREFVEGCYAKDTMGTNEDSINSGMLDEETNYENDKKYVIDVQTGEVIDGPFDNTGEIPLRLMGFDGSHKVVSGSELSGMLDEQGVAEGSDELYGLRVGDTVKAVVNGKRVQGDVIDIFPETMEVELLLRGANAGRTVTVDVRDTEALSEQGVAEGSKEETPGIALSKAYKKDFDDKKPGQDRKETALTGAYSKTGKPGGELKKQGVAEGSKEDFTMNARQADPRINKYATNPKQTALGKAGSAVGNVLKKAGSKVMNKLHPSDERLRSDPLEETSELERSLRQSTKEKDMFESKFTKLEKKLDKQPGITDPAALAASIGRKKLGQKEMTRRSKAARNEGLEESTGVTDYNPKSQGGTRKELLAKLAKSGSSADATAARKAGATQSELKAAIEKSKSKSVEESKLKGKQSKLDVDKDGKLEKSDFAALRSKKKDAQMESWERQLSSLLTEGMTVSTSVGNDSGQDTVSITANDADAHKLLQILQNAGIGSGVPAGVISSPATPAQVSTATSPATASTGGSAADDSVEGPASNVSSMPMPRGMAFSVQPEETEVPTEPEEFGVVDSEEVFDTLGKEHSASEKVDNGDDALSFLKKAIGHGTEYADGKQEVTTDNTPTPTSSKAPETEVNIKQVGSSEEEVEESDTDNKKPDEDKDGVPDWADKKPGKDDNAEDDSEDDSEDEESDDEDKEKVEEGRQECSECGGIMEDDHECGQLNEWSNSPQAQSEDEQFESDMNFMQNVISGGLNGRKSTGQTTTPVIASQANRQMSEGYKINVADEMRKLAGIR